ncbi:MAG: hypothetical protein J7L51_04355 [Desulfurococcales archaeon]|nr:hypothetical protein [Desulfurococcales archaeon]
MLRLRYIVIEHLEPCISPWLLSEYSYTTSLLKDLGLQVVFTNVSKPRDAAILRRHSAITFESSITSDEMLKELGISSIIVLDPKAEKPLKSKDIASADAVVIGGIMGDYPPKGRTWELITSRIPSAEPRNLGKKQLTIAGAAYVLRKVLEGIELEEIPIKEGLAIPLKLGKYELTIELPYAFPYADGKPVLPDDYIEIVAKKILLFESNGACRDE